MRAIESRVESWIGFSGSPAHSQLSTPNWVIFSRFARIHGSGIFTIEEFTALTGFPLPRALEILSEQEDLDHVLRLDLGIYLLKPPLPEKQSRSWYDWKFQEPTQRRIFEACTKWRSLKYLLPHIGLKTTALSRYLRAMERSGNLISLWLPQQDGIRQHKVYLAHIYRPLGSYSAELIHTSKIKKPKELS